MRRSLISSLQQHSQFLADLEEEAHQDEAKLLAMLFEDSDGEENTERQPILHRAPNKDRDATAGHERLMADYLNDDSVYDDGDFERRFRVTKGVFIRLCNDLQSHHKYFIQKPDCTGKLGLSTPQKVTCALRQLGYGVSADATDEYVRIGETTARMTLKLFASSVISIYGAKYLRKPTEEDLNRILIENASRGFPGCLGSLDCMHVGWKNCPTAWSGQYTGKEKEPTIVLEAVATQNRWIWHSFFGTPGTNNNLNILDRSPLFDDIVNSRSPTVNFRVNRSHYNSGYYLCDGIYPSWAVFIKSIPTASDLATKHFNTIQEACRKDIERAFGSLQSKWHILTSPIRFWYEEDIHSIVLCCIILHNMMVEERDSNISIDRTCNPTHEIIPPTFSNSFEERRQVANNLRSERVHRDLTDSLVKYAWEQRGSIDQAV